jgi:hypothetical protein
VKRSVMCDMRRLASLFIFFKDECIRLQQCPEANFVSDMVSRSRFPALEAAIYKCTAKSESGQIKAGLKLSLYYLLKKLAKTVKSSFLVANA